MGNESSTTEALTEAHAESLTQRDDRALLTDSSTSHRSLLSEPVFPDVPVITGVEESRGAASDQEDKEELEFPHDLLPSLDFSSELNIWESSLGPLPSLESPQLEFLTPTEEVAAPLRQEEIPPPEQAAEKTTEIQSLLKKPTDLPGPLKKTTDPPEPTQQSAELYKPTQSTKVEFTEEPKNGELPEPTKKEEEPPYEFPEEKQPVTSLEEAAEIFRPTKIPEQIPEPVKNEVEFLEPAKDEEPEPTTETIQPEKELISELTEEQVEKPVEIPPVEPFTVPAEKTTVTETIQEPAEELQDSGSHPTYRSSTCCLSVSTLVPSLLLETQRFVQIWKEEE